MGKITGEVRMAQIYETFYDFIHEEDDYGINVTGLKPWTSTTTAFAVLARPTYRRFHACP